jgi:hypothetical protein
MVKEEPPQKNWDPEKLWTTQGVRHCWNKDDPLCRSGMAQERVVRKDCTRAKVERATQTVGLFRKNLRMHHEGKCVTKDLGGKRPPFREKEEGNSDRHQRVELKTTITSGKKSIGIQEPQEDPRVRICEASRRDVQCISRNKDMCLVER